MTKKRDRQPKKPTHREWSQEHWFEFIEYFDAKKPIDLKDRTFLLGTIDEVAFVQVPKGMNLQAKQHISEGLARAGVQALLVTSDINFVKLRMCSPDIEKVLYEEANGRTLIRIPKEHSDGESARD